MISLIIRYITMQWLVFLSLSLLCSASLFIYDLTTEVYDSTVENNEFILVEFYQKESSACRAFSRVYEKLSAEITNSNRPCVLARMDDTDYSKQSQMLEIFEYPALVMYINGTALKYEGELTFEAILKFIDKCTREPSVELKDEDEIEEVKSTDGLHSIYVASENYKLEEYKRYSSKYRKIFFYHSSIEHVKKIFPEAEKGDTIIIQDGDVDIIKVDISSDDYPAAIDVFSRPPVLESGEEFLDLVYEPFKRKVFGMYYDKLDPGSENQIKLFKKIAKAKRSARHLFAALDIEDDWASLFAVFSAIDKERLPSLSAFEMKKDMWTYLHKGEFTEQEILNFIDKIDRNEVPRYIKSAPIPKRNPGPVYEVVGVTFEREVIDNNQDVVLLLYGPNCTVCDDIKKIFVKLAKKWKKEGGIKFAAADTSLNDIQGNMPEAYPLVILYSAENKEHEEIFTGKYTEFNIMNFIEEKSTNIQSPHDRHDL